MMPPQTNDDDKSQDRETTDDSQTSRAADAKVDTDKRDQATPSMLKFLSLAKPEMPVLILAIVIMAASESTSLINPLILAQAYNTLVDPSLNSSQKISEINRVMILVLVIHVLGVVGAFIRSSLLSVAAERVVARVRNQLYSKLLTLEIAFFDERKTGELTSRLGNDTTQLQQGITMPLPESILGIVKLIVAIALMFWISPTLAAVTLGFVFVIFSVAALFAVKLKTLSKDYQDVLGRAQTHSTEALGAMRTVQSFVAEESEAERFRKAIGEPAKYKFWWPVDAPTNKTTYSIGFFRAILTSGFFTFVFGVGFGSLYVSLWYGFKLVTDGKLSLGDLTAFQSYIFQIGGSLGSTSQQIARLFEAQGASARIFELLEKVPAIPTPPSPPESKSDQEGPQDVESTMVDPVHTPINPPLIPESINGTIEFRNVNFSYPSRPDSHVLENVSLTIPPDSTAALVGPSGAGKSTIVALLQRFYDIQGGSITVDGNDIRDLDLKWLRKHIGFVQQEPQLFGMTIRENILYGVGKREVSQAEVEDVCRKANAHDFIVQWPKGYDTLVGERGVKLSGGQKQRLAIARALLVGPKILIFDEATSALDAESEHLVQAAIDRAVEGRTVLIVAHRLSTIQRADQIFVVDENRIVDVGSHSELLGRCKKYQDLIKRQFNAAESSKIEKLNTEHE